MKYNPCLNLHINSVSVIETLQTPMRRVMLLGVCVTQYLVKLQPVFMTVGEGPAKVRGQLLSVNCLMKSF